MGLVTNEEGNDGTIKLESDVDSDDQDIQTICNEMQVGHGSVRKARLSN